MDRLKSIVSSLSQEQANELLDHWWKKNKDTLAHWWTVSPLPTGKLDEPGDGSS